MKVVTADVAVDLQYGDYPYMSSSNCIIAAAVNTGAPPQSVREIVEPSKPCTTYTGSEVFPSGHPELDMIQRVGNESGATTGRPRQCSWLDLTTLVKAANIDGVTNKILSKLDALRAR